MAFARQTDNGNSGKMIWANLLHLGTNMWEDHPYLEWPEGVYKDDYQCKNSAEAYAWMRGYRPFLIFNEPVWNDILQNMVTAGMNMVIIDLGDGVKYESHPEIAVKNAWSTGKLKKELAKIRELGLEPIPKLNFATTHDAWMGEYSRMVSTKRYYEVCRNLIDEVVDLFDTPRFFHLGMDEEVAHHQMTYNYAVMRQNDLWWNDLYFYIDQVEKKGVRPWVWADYGWHQPEVFFKKMPKSVLQSNWYYGKDFDVKTNSSVNFYNDLEAHGYDQMPTGSNWDNNDNMEYTVEHCKNNIDPSRLHGFIMASWFPTIEVCRDKHKEAISQIMSAKKRFYR
ncbi:MAG TPA: Tat pathway signal protein [Porphyromonadaceae bacterium]|nr:Tat pathway signal protein [Porphyromonadaceae bacterium]HBK31573.1 Tat pathway signal protein [Porphyromonadaceae bacterium]HBL34136.1 Tat pathway signal protein [Porphyromonadaceae bacterium]HBX19769.1 Tat pathway signal protein [Porphyromonadaceae bacterium]HCM19408.1 Tat pathway signal protein [Porphyromonadaceae bacterium]